MLRSKETFLSVIWSIVAKLSKYGKGKAMIIVIERLLKNYKKVEFVRSI